MAQSGAQPRRRGASDRRGARDPAQGNGRTDRAPFGAAQWRADRVQSGARDRLRFRGSGSEQSRFAGRADGSVDRGNRISFLDAACIHVEPPWFERRAQSILAMGGDRTRPPGAQSRSRAGVARRGFLGPESPCLDRRAEESGIVSPAMGWDGRCGASGPQRSLLRRLAVPGWRVHSQAHAPSTRVRVMSVCLFRVSCG